MLRTICRISGLLLLANGVCSADLVTLDIQADLDDQTWQVFANVSDTCDGLASFYLDVYSSGGATVTGSTLVAARVWNPALNPPDGDFEGWSLFRNHGTNGIGIRASQNTVANDINYLWLNEGIGTHLLLAAGTYGGKAGYLTAEVHPGGFFNVFPDGFVAGGSTVPATVESDTVFVPGPASVTAGLIGLSVVGSILRRRKSWSWPG